jgi:hypothetical protein
MSIGDSVERSSNAAIVEIENLIDCPKWTKVTG